MPFSLSILRRLSLPNPVSPDPDSYSLSELLLESLLLAFSGRSDRLRTWLSYTPAHSCPHASYRAYAWWTAYLRLQQGDYHPCHSDDICSYCASGAHHRESCTISKTSGFRLVKPPPDVPLLGLPFSGRAVAALSFNHCFSV
jgi:hypothetical protein